MMMWPLALFAEERPRSKPLRSRAMGLCLEEACKLECRVPSEEGIQAYNQAPSKSLLHIPVPARYDASSAVYSVS